MIERTVFSTEEHKMVQESAAAFFQKEVVPFHDEWEEKGMIAREAWTKAGEAGLLCTGIPDTYGGPGLDFSYSAVIMEELAKTGCTGPGFFFAFRHCSALYPPLWYGSTKKGMAAQNDLRGSDHCHRHDRTRNRQ